jgi:hypothetical protein
LVAEEVGSSEHIVECPEHVNFRSVEPAPYSSYWIEGVPEHTERDRKQAYAHHLAKLSYRDINNNLLHRPEHPPFLWVMLIAPRRNESAESKVMKELLLLEFI